VIFQLKYGIEWSILFRSYFRIRLCDGTH